MPDPNELKRQKRKEDKERLVKVKTEYAAGNERRKENSSATQKKKSMAVNNRNDKKRY